jgi:hypothetical protein
MWQVQSFFSGIALSVRKERAKKVEPFLDIHRIDILINKTK